MVTPVATRELARARSSPSSRRSRVRNANLGLALFLAAHVPLAIAMKQSESVSTLHALLTLAIGLLWVVFGRCPERGAYVGAYITGAEVLWRMTNASIFWEFGKYAIVLIFGLAMLRRKGLKVPPLPLLYFALLLPSTLLLVTQVGLSAARGSLSFNLAGPFALMVSAWYFSRLRLSPDQVRRIFLTLIAPVIGVASVTLYAIATSTSLHFTGESNAATSGGFGPNQVSAVLGLGALLLFLFVMIGRASWSLRSVMLVGMLILAGQSALTFSRGGLYNAAGSAILASCYLMRDRASRAKLILVIVAFSLITTFVLLPGLNAFTGGALMSRFQSTGTTGRDRIVVEDLRIWQEHPYLGVGPGQAMFHRESFSHPMAAHTEFSRLLAEHGVFGLMALGLLLLMSVHNLMRARTPASRALVAAVLGWSFIYMLGAGMRLVAPSFLFGFPFATLALGEAPVRAQRMPRSSRRRRPVPLIRSDAPSEEAIPHGA